MIKELSVSDFRNLKQASFRPTHAFNLLIGPIGAGKTSLLEAIHVLSSGHSFRTRKIRELISHHADGLTLTAKLLDEENNREHRVGMRKERTGDTQLRFDYEPLHNMAELTRMVPVKALHPDCHELVQSGPQIRRQFMDWGLFHVKPQFYRIWKQYRRALNQRNECLRQQSPKREIEAWNEELGDAGEQIAVMRNEYAAQLQTRLNEYLDRLDAPRAIKLTHRPGWAQEFDLTTALQNSIEQCQRFRTTTVGCHRAELSITMDGVIARQILSRGQQKLLVYALHFSQISLLSDTGKHAIMLCDDLPSELDRFHVEQVLGCLSDLSLQTFITSHDPVDLSAYRSFSVFHVERGQVQEVI